jgi:hypothetical protein
MDRYITCVVANSSKRVRAYEATSYMDALEKIKEDNKDGFRLKYIRDMDRDDGHLYREAIGNPGSYGFQ